MGKRRERREREAGSYYSSEKESDEQQGPVAKETVTLIYSHQNQSPEIGRNGPRMCVWWWGEAHSAWRSEVQTTPRQ